MPALRDGRRVRSAYLALKMRTSCSRRSVASARIRSSMNQVRARHNVLPSMLARADEVIES